jgi:hypothetical protein
MAGTSWAGHGLPLCICAQPTFSFIKGGEHLGSFSGADKDQLKAMLEELR